MLNLCVNFQILKINQKPVCIFPTTFINSLQVQFAIIIIIIIWLINPCLKKNQTTGKLSAFFHILSWGSVVQEIWAEEFLLSRCNSAAGKCCRGASRKQSTNPPSLGRADPLGAVTVPGSSISAHRVPSPLFVLIFASTGSWAAPCSLDHIYSAEMPALFFPPHLVSILFLPSLFPSCYIFAPVSSFSPPKKPANA